MNDELKCSDRAAVASLIPKLPNFFRPNRGDAVPSDLVGSRIVGVGTSVERIEGGGLIIDYVRGGEDKKRRVVFGFNELGMWVEYHSSQDGVPRCDL